MVAMVVPIGCVSVWTQGSTLAAGTGFKMCELPEYKCLLNQTNQIKSNQSRIQMIPQSISLINQCNEYRRTTFLRGCFTPSSSELDSESSYGIHPTGAFALPLKGIASLWNTLPSRSSSSLSQSGIPRAKIWVEGRGLRVEGRGSRVEGRGFKI
jgi:hypothetical protein